MHVLDLRNAMQNMEQSPSILVLAKKFLTFLLVVSHFMDQGVLTTDLLERTHKKHLLK